MDPIADMFSAIKNAIMRKKDFVDVPSSKVKERILDVLKREGFIKDWERIEENKKGTQYTLRIYLRYLDPKKERSAITNLIKVSTPGRRVYAPVKEVPYVRRGLGIALVSTDAGIITDHEARRMKKGGEIIGIVW
ncbi:MAG TPA: 30S ribosomal protein S8 [Aquificaceae bacterium]|nr:30S ribosomal protein S8 [Aquificaceae bacterium]HIQ31714.1 30S ribosomal protein S8 [Aquifex aeolicus]